MAVFSERPLSRDATEQGLGPSDCASARARACAAPVRLRTLPEARLEDRHVRTVLLLSGGQMGYHRLPSSRCAAQADSRRRYNYSCITDKAMAPGCC
ncbi:hypothetical protein NN561_014733 [Cricetulus griseus]